MSFFKRKNDKNSISEAGPKGPYDDAKPSWSNSFQGQFYKEWPKKDGTPEEPAFLKHCTSVDMEDEMLISMLSAYGIPAVKLYPSNGSFGKVVLGMSAEGTDIFVPISMLDDATSLMGGFSND